MNIHELKCWPEYFEAIADGKKSFEIRKDDRGYKTGDKLHLREFDPMKGPEEAYSGKELFCWVNYCLRDTNFGVQEGFVVMSISVMMSPVSEVESGHEVIKNTDGKFSVRCSRKDLNNLTLDIQTLQPLLVDVGSRMHFYRSIAEAIETTLKISEDNDNG